MAHKFAIFISRWNKDDVLFYDSKEDALQEWSKICSQRYALKTDGGKNVVVTDPRQGGVGRIYSTVHYQRSW